ncbi:MAG: manganese efflux pump [Firmicutes bacterium]|nr:manganese efflux pump [Bacillota bacterium]
MTFTELFLLAVGLAMDAFAVSVCKGLALPRVDMKKALAAGLWFGGFQALMPLLGYLLGSRFASYIADFDHWIAFVLLALIGGNMIRESFGDEEEADASFGVRAMLPLALATSIDALAVGLTFAFLSVRVLPAVTLIGVVTLIISMIGVKLGNLFGARFRGKAEFAGGLILILLGVKILLQHLGILG